MGSNLPHAPEAAFWLEHFEMEDHSQTLGRNNLRAVDLCAKAQILFESDAQEDEWLVLQLLQLVKYLVVLDLEYQAWSDAKTGIWRHRIARTTSEKTPSTHDQIFPKYVYHDIYVACVWNNYRFFRIHFNEVLLHCVELLQAHPTAQTAAVDFEAIIKQSKSVIREMILDICASLPFSLGIIDSNGKPTKGDKRMPLCGYMSVWPAYVAMVSAEPDSPTKNFLREKLEYISAALGVRSGTMLAYRDREQRWKLR